MRDPWQVYAPALVVSAYLYITIYIFQFDSIVTIFLPLAVIVLVGLLGLLFLHIYHHRISEKIALLQAKQQWEKALEELGRFRRQCKNTERNLQYYYQTKIEILQAMGDFDQAQQTQADSENIMKIFKKIESEKVETKATAAECRQAAVRWLLSAVLLLVVYVISIMTEFIYDGISVVCLYFGIISLLVSFVWGILWLIRKIRAPENL